MAARPTGVASDGLAVGTPVVLHSLVARPALNGRSGVVVSALNATKGRHGVRVEGESEPLALKPTNLTATQPDDAVPPAPAGQATDLPPSGEEGLIAAVQRLRFARPQATTKELHAALSAQEWPSLTLGELKKAASKAAKRAPREADPPTASASLTRAEPPAAAAACVPFEAGSVVTDRDGRKFKVVKSRKDGLVSVITTGRQRAEMRQEELVLIDTARNTCPTGFELITQSPSVGRIDQCDALAEIVAERAAPPQLMMRPWDSFGVCAQRCGSPTIAGLVTHPQLAWGVPPGQPPAQSRVVCFALDAVAHHLVIEWRVGRGWRLLQSYLRPERAGPRYGEIGYTALEWVTATRPCGGADTRAHRRFGQGRWLSDADVLQILQAILRLRSLTDALVTRCLLPQTPFRIGPRPQEHDRSALQAWLTSVEPVGEWAGEKIHAAESRGATISRPPGHDVQVALGDPTRGDALEVLFSVPEAAAAEIDAAYAEFTGEKFGAIHYLRLLNYVESDYTQYVRTAEGRAKLRAKQQERERLFKTSQLDGAQRTEKERDHFGWVVRCIHWGQD